MQNITRTTCRICDSPLQNVLSLGEQYVNTFPSEWPAEDLLTCPIELALCTNEECELLQLRHTAPQEILYAQNYWYESGINEKIVNDLKEIAGLFPAEEGRWIDIGANDGTLLKYVEGYFKVGVEPATNLIEKLTVNTNAIFHGFWEDYDDVPADIITAIGMFYDLENPNTFVANMKKHLKEGGTIIAQLMTLKPMLDNVDLGNLCHEHLEHYSYKSLKFLFERNGLEIFHVEENDINGGSYRIFARHLDEGSVEYEETFSLMQYKEFEKRIHENYKRMFNYLMTEKARGKTIYAYGASTKGNTILQTYGLGPDIITGVADRNSFKWGKHMLTGVPIVSEEEGRANADIFFVLPWGFKDGFIEREANWLNDGGTMVFSTPEFYVHTK